MLSSRFVERDHLFSGNLEFCMKLYENSHVQSFGIYDILPVGNAFLIRQHPPLIRHVQKARNSTVRVDSALLE